MSKPFAMSPQELFNTLDPDHHATVRRWLDRGDGVAVYRNADLGHPEIGHLQFVSYGSKDAQIESDEPPQKMPDIGGAINWRYQLHATVKRSEVTS